MTETVDRFTIRFPARPGYLRVSRLNAAAIGAAAGLDVDQLDDLRLAVNEAVTWLLADEDAGGELELALQAIDGTVQIELARTGSDLPRRALDGLIEAILAVTVDQFELHEQTNHRRAITMSTSSQPNARSDA